MAELAARQGEAAQRHMLRGVGSQIQGYKGMKQA